MKKRSSENCAKKTAFIGLYVCPATKRRVEQEADAEEVSVSEIVRRRLSSAESSTKRDQ